MAKVLVIGSGGREHALAYKLSQSKRVTEVFVAPGNVGMESIATRVDLSVCQLDELAQFAKQNEIDLTIVGPEDPLVHGIVDVFESYGLVVFGPSKAAAALEGSKRYAKDIMKKYNIPTADYQTFIDLNQAKKYLKTQTFPIVIKASGLAAGKGVIIALTLEDANLALEDMMVHHKFSDAADEVVIESFLEGEEFSFLCLVQDDIILPLEIAQDHKRAFENDEGPNTGGMGAYAPVASITEADRQTALKQVVYPTIDAMKKEGNPFNGVLYAGLMKTKDGIKVIEYNVRFGDPETEILMVALESDLYDVLIKLKNKCASELKWSQKMTIGAVMASQGYPDGYASGSVIENLDKVNSIVFHMGTQRKNGKIVTAGGRVLCVVAQGDTLKQAQVNLYSEIDKISCDTLFYRKDIGFHNLKEDI